MKLFHFKFNLMLLKNMNKNNKIIAKTEWNLNGFLKICLKEFGRVIINIALVEYVGVEICSHLFL